VHTSESGLCLNTFIVLDQQGQPPGRRQKDRERLVKHLVETLRDPESLPALVKRRVPRQLKQLPTPTQVTIVNKPGVAHSELTVIASDRPGLLASIGLLFAELELNVLEARIATLGERVEDVFAIRDADDRPIRDRERIYLLENTIRQRLDAQIARER
jgi:[protein-PII] uridylyltransferase